MAEKADRTVVRNAAYRRGGLNKRERHNERKNINYRNDDICPERAVYNVHFKRCEETGDDEISGYEKTVDRMIADGVISTHGLGKDPNIVDELVFDVNTSYFERHGGYEYAKTFYEEAYRLAVELIGGEQYVLSAVMHADERNSDISEQLGRDVYHYHLHVVYVPVVQKELRFKKNHRDPELRGKPKGVITQISHSKKWPMLQKVDENGEPVRTKTGKAILVNSYSLLQDQFFEHMRAAGYDDIERGERGSTAEHLSVLEFKAKQEREKAAAAAAEVAAKQEAAAILDTEIQGKEQAVASLDEQAGLKKKQLARLVKKTDVAKQEADDFAGIDRMGEKRTILGDTPLSHADWKTVSGLAKEGIKSRAVIADLRKRLAETQKALNQTKSKQGGFIDNLRIVQETSEYREAVKLFPDEVKAFIADILQTSRAQKELARDPRRLAVRGEAI